MKKIILSLLFIFGLFISQGWCATNAWQGDDATNPTLYNVAENWSLSHTPADGEDVEIGTTSDNNLNVNAATTNLKSWDMTGYSGTMSGASAITVVGSASATDVVKFAGTVTWNGGLNLSPTAADTNIQLTSGGKTLAAITINGNAGAGYNTHGVFLMDNLTASGVMGLTQGAIHFDGASDSSALTHTIYQFSSANSSATRYVYLGASTMTFTRSGSASWDLNNPTNLTLSCGTSSLIFTPNTQYTTFSGGYLTYYSVTMNSPSGTNNNTIQNGTFTNVTINGLVGAGKTATTHIGGAITVNGALAFVGNSLTNRLLITNGQFSGQGSPVTITLGASATCATNSSNVDFRDITFSGGASGAQDFRTITGLSGNCGGVSFTNVTGDSGLTTADDWYWNGSGTRNFSDYTYWYDTTNGAGSQMASTRVPLPQDTCYYNADSIDGATTVDQDLPRIPGINFTNVGAMNFHMDNINQTTYGSITYVANVTLTVSSNLTFEGRDSFTFTPLASSTAQNIIIQAAGGTIQLLGNLDIGSKTLTLNYGTFDANDYNVTTANFNSDNARARTLLMGSGTWTINSTTAGNTWDMGNITGLTNPTTMGEGSTLVWGGNTNNALVFEGGGCTYNNITIPATGTGHSFTGSNNFATFTITKPKTVKFTKSTTTAVASFVATGDVSNTIILDTVDGAGTFALSDTTGTNAVEYCSIARSVAQGGATWNATNSIDGGSNTGWNITGASTGASNFIMIGE